MRVLDLVTNPEARFYKQQAATLASRGVARETLAVPGHDPDGRRSPLDYLRYLPRVLREPAGRYDLVHANYGLTAPYALAKAGLAASGAPWGRRSGKRLPVVLSLWGSDLLGRVGPVSRWCARRCDAVVVMSRAMADALDVPCRVVPHGVDLDLFRPTSGEAARAEVGWEPDATVVLFPYPPEQTVKNHPRAERVVDAAADRLDRPVELRTVTGVPHDRMPAYVNAADALVLTSEREGSPNSVKEAMACNVPVVATDVGDVRERLAGVEPSVVATSDRELVDGLVAVLESDERSNGRAAVREQGLSLERMASRLLDVYEDVA